MTSAPFKKSDLGVRAASAVVMLAVAGAALLLGGLVWGAFVLVIGAGVLWEWAQLVFRFEPRPLVRGVWLAGGLVYVGLACFTLLVMRSPFYGIGPVLVVLATVIAVDIGAYFTGRTFGGPKIAPQISPSKTWSGLVGGMVGAVLVIALALYIGHTLSVSDYEAAGKFGFMEPPLPPKWLEALFGIPIAIIAQTGDFFESWMKRRAKVKDSSNLIPGHGGLFDRVDGLLAVLFAIGVIGVISGMSA